MLQVVIGVILLVAGLFAVIKMPIAGVPMILVGFLLANSAPKGAGDSVQSLFFGIAALCGLALLVVGFFQMIT